MIKSAPIVLVLLVTACGEDYTAQDTRACGFFDEGPYDPITATSFKDAQTPEIGDEPVAHTITLPATGIGYVRFTAERAGTYLVYLDRAVTFAVQDEGSVPIALSDSETSVDACATVKARHAFSLSTGGAFLALGPDTGGPVNLVIEAGDAD